MVAAEKGATVEAIPVDVDGVLDLAALQDMLDERVKMVACGHVSNALGTVNPVEQVIRLAHGVGALTLIDGAQAVSHWPVDMQALDCDFTCFPRTSCWPDGAGCAVWQGSAAGCHAALSGRW
ncbi:aminotransferase class V-fold PLP-dependent enzyme [Halopseudomonas pachastrellae]|nr:aminotransferase class V-fold PLP-dependent enzyme [Halopseudomonas pachastrellae]